MAPTEVSKQSHVSVEDSECRGLIEHDGAPTSAPCSAFSRKRVAICGALAFMAAAAVALRRTLTPCLPLGTAVDEHSFVSLAAEIHEDIEGLANLDEARGREDVLHEWLTTSQEAGDMGEEAADSQEVSATIQDAVSKAMAVKDKSEAERIVKRSMGNALARWQRKRRSLKTYLKAHKRSLGKGWNKRNAAQKTQITTCVFNALLVADQIAAFAINMNDAMKTCHGLNIWTANILDTQTGTCFVNVGVLYGSLAGIAASLSAIATVCAETLVPNVDALCASAVTGLLSTLGILQGSAGLIAYTCGQDQSKIPPDVKPSNIGRPGTPGDYVLDLKDYPQLAGVAVAWNVSRANNFKPLNFLDLAKGKIPPTLNFSKLDLSGLGPDGLAALAGKVGGGAAAAPAGGAALGASAPGAAAAAGAPAPAPGGSTPAAAPTERRLEEAVPGQNATHSAPARKLLLGGGVAAMNAYCAVDVTSFMWLLANIGISINGAANHQRGVCPPRNIVGGRTIKGPLYKQAQSFCSLAVSGVLVSIAGAASVLQFALVQCADELNLAALCGSGVASAVAAMAGIASTGSLMHTVCDIYQKQPLKASIKVAREFDKQSGGLLSDLAGLPSPMTGKPRRLSDAEAMADIQARIADTKSKFSSPLEAFKSIGYDLGSKDAEWYRDAMHLRQNPHLYGVAPPRDILSAFEEPAPEGEGAAEAGGLFGGSGRCRK